jgi:peptidoglycan/LPS O-acetylase OafA/YrhL
VWLWFYYFALGAWLGACSRDTSARLSRLRWAALALVAGGVLVASGVAPEIAAAFQPPASAPYAHPSILLGATLVGLALPSLAGCAAPRALRRLGADTFGVFVLNPAVLLLWSGLAGAASSVVDSWLRAAATVVLTLPLASLLRRRAAWLLP